MTTSGQPGRATAAHMFASARPTAPGDRGRVEELIRARPAAQGLTIDALTAKDLDDAIWLTTTPEETVVQVSISDVAERIRPGSPGDQEAAHRAFTRYRQSRTVPMLPRLLAEERSSLLPGELRPTLTISMPVQPDLTVGPPTLTHTHLVSQQRLSPAEADTLLQEATTPEGSLLRECADLARRLLEQRRRQGALALYDPARGLLTSEEGEVRLVPPDLLPLSQLIVQEFMILANAAVARWCAEQGIPLLYRNHTATPLAPPRDTLLRDLANTLAYPNAFDAELLNRRLRLVFNRATYGVTLEGHYGLNLAAYTHVTSPIRRYADLINQRILKAVIRGKRPPYTREQLAAIAQQINAVENRVKEEQSAYWREQATQRARSLAARGTIERLEPKELDRVLKVAAREELISGALEQVISAQLAGDTLALTVAYSLLLEMKGQTEQEQRIKCAVIQWLRDKSHKVSAIFTMTEQKLGWPPVTYDEEERSLAGRQIFSAAAHLVLPGISYHSDTKHALTKRRAQQLAAVDLLARILGLVISVASDEIVTQPATTRQNRDNHEREQTKYAAGTVGVNHKGRLQEVAQQLKWLGPVYHTVALGPAHDPSFRVRVEVQSEDATYAVETEAQASKRVAEQAAARQLLEQMERLGLLAQLTPPGQVVGNAVGALQEWSQQVLGTSPSYRFEEAIRDGQLVFTCFCTLDLPTGQSVTYHAQGPSKKLAKQQAAALAWGGRGTGESARQEAAMPGLDGRPTAREGFKAD